MPQFELTKRDSCDFCNKEKDEVVVISGGGCYKCDGSAPDIFICKDCLIKLSGFFNGIKCDKCGRNIPFVFDLLWGFTDLICCKKCGHRQEIK